MRRNSYIRTSSQRIKQLRYQAPQAARLGAEIKQTLCLFSKSHCFVMETLASCVSLGQALYLPCLSFPVGQMGDNNSTNLLGLLGGVSESAAQRLVGEALHECCYFIHLFILAARVAWGS